LAPQPAAAAHPRRKRVQTDGVGFGHRRDGAGDQSNSSYPVATLLTWVPLVLMTMIRSVGDGMQSDISAQCRVHGGRDGYCGRPMWPHRRHTQIR
jgi:hypothetical protein